VTVVELDVEGVRSHFVRDGRHGAMWAPGACSHAEMRLCWSMADAIRLAQDGLSGTEAMAATRIVDAEAPAPGALLPPLGFVPDAQIVTVPEMFGASLRAQLRRRMARSDRSPSSSTSSRDSIRERFAAVDGADVVVTLPYQAIASSLPSDLSSRSGRRRRARRELAALQHSPASSRATSSAP
jgi:hypothetical protein